MSNEERARLRAGNFVHNNGLVLRIINILRYKYNRLTGVKDVVAGHGVSEDEYLDSVNFLAEEGYIHLRLAADKTPASLADNDYRDIESKLTGKGIRLLSGGIRDNQIEV